MFDRDIPKIRNHILSNPAGLVDAITFVLCTIRQPFQTVATQMDDIRAHGQSSVYLFAHKRQGYAYAVEHAEVLHAAVSKAVECGDTIGAIDVLSNVPGLGMVKAAFVAQLAGLNVACLDTHNLRRLGLSKNAVTLAKTVKHETRLAKIADYVETCIASGGSRHWWNTWCEYVAGSRYNKALPSGDIVSAYHVECITRRL